MAKPRILPFCEDVFTKIPEDRGTSQDDAVSMVVPCVRACVFSLL